MKTVQWLASLGLVVLIAGCQMTKTGGVIVQVPAPNETTSRAVTANDGKGDWVRIQLLRNGAVIPLSQGAPFVEQKIAGQKVALSELPPGPGYTLNVATGEKKDSGYFEVAYFESSRPFSITAGVDTVIDLKLKKAPLFVIGEGSVDHAVTSSDNQLIYLRDRLVKVFAPSKVSQTASQEVSVTLPAGASTVRSLNTVSLPKGTFGPAVFLNTDKGIGFWDFGESIVFPTMQHNVKDANDDFQPEPFVSVPDIYFSGSFSALDDEGVTRSIYTYGGKGLTAGLVIATSDDDDIQTLSDIVWYDLDEMLKLDDMKDIKEQLEGGEPVVTSISRATDFAWLATKLALFKVDKDLIAGDTEDMGDQLIEDESLMIEASLDGRSVPVDFVAVVDGRGYAGTYRGLFTGALNAAGIVELGSYTKEVIEKETVDGVETDVTKVKTISGPLTLVPGTRFQEITALAAFKHLGNAYAAAHNKTNNELIIVKNGVVVDRVLGFAGLPRGELSLAWYLQGSTPSVAIAGDNATVVYTVPQ